MNLHDNCKIHIQIVFECTDAPKIKTYFFYLEKTIIITLQLIVRCENYLVITIITFICKKAIYSLLCLIHCVVLYIIF